MAYSNCWHGFEVIRCLWAGYYKYAPETRYNHPTQKPLKVIKFLVIKCSKPGDIILDPFLGSGTTAVACKELGRHFIGIEINPEYCKIAERRLAQTAHQPELAL